MPVVRAQVFARHRAVGQLFDLDAAHNRNRTLLARPMKNAYRRHTYLKKGSQVYIEGRIQSRKYTDKNGIERTAYEIIGSEMKMLGSGNDSGQQNAQHTPPAPPSRQAPAAPAQPVDDIDDDVPF